MRKIYCKDCRKLISKWAFYGKNVRCPSCRNIFFLSGKKHTENTKQKMRLAHLGEKCYEWKGGHRTYYSKIAKAIYYEHHTNILCEHCGSIEKIHIHHKDKNWRNNNIDNLQALCKSCHNSFHKHLECFYFKRNKLGQFIKG